MIEWLLLQIKENDIFNGVLGGAGLTILHYLYKRLEELLYFRITRSISFDDSTFGSNRFVTVSKWISSLKGNSNYSSISIIGFWNELLGRTDIGYIAGNGTHWFIYNKKLVSVTVNTNYSGNTPTKVIVMRVYLTCGSKFLDALLLSLDQFYYGDNFDTIPTFTNSGSEWSEVKGVKRKSFDKIILKDEIKENLIKDITEFLSKKEWYMKHQLRYKRGYMFYGKPGTGKTNTIVAIATHLDFSIYFLGLGAVMSDKQLMELLLTVPPKSLIVFEEIDCFNASKSRTAVKSDIKEMSLSALLNTLDGILSHDNQIVILTTNHPEALDEALTRDGRIDHKVEFEEFGKLEAERLFEVFYPGEPFPFDVEYPISPAKLENMIKKHTHKTIHNYNF